MSFDRRDIRPMMDVFTSDNIYLGAVLAITPGAVEPTPFDERVAPSVRQSSAVSGELLGPMPTLPIGNHGPEFQAAWAHYATTPDNAQPLGAGSITVGQWLGLKSKRTIPLALVQTVAMERVVLSLTKRELEEYSG